METITSRGGKGERGGGEKELFYRPWVMLYNTCISKYFTTCCCFIISSNILKGLRMYF